MLEWLHGMLPTSLEKEKSRRRQFQQKPGFVTEERIDQLRDEVKNWPIELLGKEELKSACTAVVSDFDQLWASCEKFPIELWVYERRFFIEDQWELLSFVSQLELESWSLGLAQMAQSPPAESL